MSSACTLSIALIWAILSMQCLSSWPASAPDHIRFSSPHDETSPPPSPLRSSPTSPSSPVWKTCASFLQHLIDQVSLVLSPSSPPAAGASSVLVSRGNRSAIPPMGSNPFDLLPDELVIKIFSQLSDPSDFSTLAQCDHRFRRLMFDSHAMRYLNLQRKHVSLTGMFLEATLYLHTLEADQTQSWLTLFTNPDTAPWALHCVTLHNSLAPLPLEEQEDAPPDVLLDMPGFLLPEEEMFIPIEQMEDLGELGIPWIPAPEMPQDADAPMMGLIGDEIYPIDEPVLDENPLFLAMRHLLGGTLTHPSRLESLDLSLNETAFQDPILIQILAHELGKNRSLQQLFLSGNNIQDIGVNVLAYALHSNTTLTHLTLDSNQIQLTECPSLERALQENHTLTHLSLDENEISDARCLANGLAKNTALTHLYLAQNNLDDEGAKSLARALKKNTSLIHLDLSDNKLGLEGISALSNALKVSHSLFTLVLDGNKLDHKSAKALAELLKGPQNQTLSILGLARNSFGPAGAHILATALEENTSLTHLYLGQNQLGVQGMESLAKALKINTSLTYLSLEENNIGKKGIRALAKALEKNQSLLHLNLDSNAIGKKGAQDLANALKFNNFLRHLDLNKCALNDEATESLIQALESNHGLHTLCLAENKIKNPNTTLWFEFLNKNSTLTSLDLEKNPLTEPIKESLCRDHHHLES